MGTKWGVINEIIERSQNEPLEKSSTLLRASLRVCSYLVYFERKKPYHLVNLIRNFILGKTKEGLLRRLFFVLRKVERFKIKDVNSFEDYAFWYLFFPKWISKKMAEEFGQDQAVKLMTEMNRLPFMTVRANTKFVSPEHLLNKLQEKYKFEGEIAEYPFIKLEKVYPVMRTQEYKSGLLTVQDLNTAKGILRLLPYLPEGSYVLDACAAPGRKSSLIAQEREDIKLFCLDISSLRMKKLISEFERLSLKKPYIIVGDASCPPFKVNFDAIIADLPCSGSGTWGKHPERRWFTSPERYLECVNIQKNILSALVPHLKKEGYLLYCTCSIWKEENEEIIKWLLNNFSSMELMEEKRIFPEKASTGFFYAILRKH